MYDWTVEIEGLNREINGLLPEYQMDLKKIFSQLIQGDVTGAVKYILEELTKAVLGETTGFLEIGILLLSIGILAALLANLTDMFENRQIADIGYYFVYLFLLLVLWKTFGIMLETAENLIGDMLLFMKLFMPVFFMAVGASSGVTTALVAYQMVLFLIYGIEAALSVFLLPLIEIYIFLTFMNGIWAEEKLHMMLELLERVIGYFLKISFAVITGISVIQAMITPVIDSVKLSAVQKTVSLIPGIGNISDSVAETVIGSAVLIKNSIGVMAVLLLFLLCAVPAVKIWCLVMLLKLCAAVSGIVSDKRIVACMDKVGEGGLLVLRTLVTASGLFFVTIAIAAMSTNKGF